MYLSLLLGLFGVGVGWEKPKTSPLCRWEIQGFLRHIGYITSYWWHQTTLKPVQLRRPCLEAALSETAYLMLKNMAVLVMKRHSKMGENAESLTRVRVKWACGKGSLGGGHMYRYWLQIELREDSWTCRQRGHFLCQVCDSKHTSGHLSRWSPISQLSGFDGDREPSHLQRLTRGAVPQLRKTQVSCEAPNCIRTIITELEKWRSKAWPLAPVEDVQEQRQVR